MIGGLDEILPLLKDPKITDNRIIARSPFHEDLKPSFYITLTGPYRGRWGDSSLGIGGTIEDLYEKLLRVSPSEARAMASKGQELVMPPINLEITNFIPAPKGPYGSKYLEGRGISPEIIESYSITEKSGVVRMPWFYRNGQVATIALRSTSDKIFTYAGQGNPISDLVYGVHKFRGHESILICESIIDALSSRMFGVFGLACGGARFSRGQSNVIKSLNPREIILAGDNDAAGRNFNEKIQASLRSYVPKLTTIRFPENTKDLNDILCGGYKLEREER